MTEPETFTHTVKEYSIGDKQLYLAGVARGQKNEQKRVLDLLQLLPFIWAEDKQMLTISRDALIELVKDGASNG